MSDSPSHLGDSTFLLDDDVLSAISDQVGMQFPLQTPQYEQEQFQLSIDLPTTPKADKIEKIIKQRLFRDPTKAGRLATRLAMEVFFDEKTLGESSLAGDRGKLNVLDEGKMADIEDIIVRMYRGKVKDIGKTVEKCREAVNKKCQYIRAQSKKRM